MLKLKKKGPALMKGPLVLIILDGVGLGPENEGNAFYTARTPVFDRLMKNCPSTALKAHGRAVGLPSDDDMGNSEVGHNALGAGRVFSQGAFLVSEAVRTGSLFSGAEWKRLVEKPLSEGSALHFIGLLSDGNVHSHEEHLYAMIDRAAADGVKNLFAHPLFDGRDVPEISAEKYLASLEKKLGVHSSAGLNYRVASGGGRMVTTMDRYEADWNIVRRGWEAHVLGTARPFSSAAEALQSMRAENSGMSDQYLPAFTVVKNGVPVGAVRDGDSVVFFNFRGDRAIEISRAFTEKDFAAFDRQSFPQIRFAGMMQYDGDLGIPENYLVNPPAIERTVSEYLAASGVRQFAVSETQKFGHVTYFWNGNRSGKFDEKTETYAEVPSDRIEFDRRPWMKAAEISDMAAEAIKSGSYDFIRLNLANGDMVGHTGNFEAAVIAAETLDLCLGWLLQAVDSSGAAALIIADHGNIDEMYEFDKKKGTFAKDPATGNYLKKTSHTLNPVPFIIYDPCSGGRYSLSPQPGAGLGNVASTILAFLGFEPPADYLPSLIVPGAE